MLVGGHVSTAGGLAKAHQRAVEFGCEAMQIFNQSPRRWQPTNHKQDDIQRFRELRSSGPVESVVIHAVYLINCASNDSEIRRKSLNSLVHALRLGDAIGAEGVVFHPGSHKDQPLEDGLRLIGQAITYALGESDHCKLLLENTAGAGDTIGRTFAELADLLERGGGDGRLGVCLDSCHLLASGYEIRGPEALEAVVDAYDSEVGLDRLGCLHVNDSMTDLGSNRDRHANLPEGELGRDALSLFMSEPRFERLAALLEVPGPDGHGPDKPQIDIAKTLRAEGLETRS